MVSNLSLFFIVISIVLSVLFPIVLVFHYRRKEKISIKVVLVGALLFFIFSQVFEKILHYFVLIKNPAAETIMKSPILFMLYGGLAAGVFEELGRYAGFKLLLKNRRQWKDGLAYGIGHGGLESILIGGMISIYYLVFALMINSGTFESMLYSLPVEQTGQIMAIRDQLLSYQPYTFAAAGIERVFALFMHIAFSILILQSIKFSKILYLLAAIVIHAVIDFPAALFQAGVITNLWIIEAFGLVIAVISIVYIVKSRKVFELEEK